MLELICTVSLQNLFHQIDPGPTRHVRQTNQSGARRASNMQQFSKVRIDRNQDAMLVGGPAKQGEIAGIRSALSRFGDIVAPRAEPVGKFSTGATVDQKSHACATRTASIRS